MWPCIVTNLFIIKPTRCINSPSLLRHETLHVSGSSSAHHQEFIHCALGTGICHTGLKTAIEQDQDRTAMTSRVCVTSYSVNTRLELLMNFRRVLINCDNGPLASSCLSVHLSARLYQRGSAGRILSVWILGYFTKICRVTSYLTKIGQQYRVLYMQT